MSVEWIRTKQPAPIAPSDLRSDELRQLMDRLFREQLELEPGSAYLLEHGSPKAVANHIRTFQWYRPYLPTTGTVLDWGCNHAPDSCLLRFIHGERLTLHSCDFVDEGRYAAFSRFARTEHKRLDDEVKLPYPPNHFDAVIGSGVLEHTALDYESLKELRRVLKPDGILVVSYLPNRWSLQEWRRRHIHDRNYHRRLYGMGEARQLLKRTGFYPIAGGYHTFFWDRLAESAGLGRWRRTVTAVLSTVLPMQVVSSTLFFIGQKLDIM